MSPLDSRERIRCILNLEEPDRIAVEELGGSVWPTTMDRWRAEGLPAGVELRDYFKYDIINVNCDTSPRYEPFTFEDTEEWIVSSDGWGNLNKRWKGAHWGGTPSLIKPSIRSLDDFKERIEPFLDASDPRRLISPRYPFRGDLEKGIRNLQKRYFVIAGLGMEPFEIVREMVGTKQICLDFLKNPNVLAYIFNKLAEYLAECGKSLVDAGVDAGFFWGDMCYNRGPFFSPAHYRKLLLPAHKKIFSVFRKRELPLIYHICGDFRPLLPDLIEAGVSALQPLEAKAGIDVRELKQEYGDELAFWGNIDIRAMSGSLEDVKKEVLSKLSAGERGGYIVGSDHSIPPTVSLKNYEYMVKLARKHGQYVR